jgi:hypothetical protein
MCEVIVILSVISRCIGRFAMGILGLVPRDHNENKEGTTEQHHGDTEHHTVHNNSSAFTVSSCHLQHIATVTERGQCSAGSTPVSSKEAKDRVLKDVFRVFDVTNDVLRPLHKLTQLVGGR